MDMGAGRVIAAGRNRAALEALARAGGARVTPVALTGDVQTDAASLRTASYGGAQLAFDMVGQAGDPNATLAALGSLRRGGRLVLMGSMTTTLPVSYLQLMANNLEIIGNFMYPTDAYRRGVVLLLAGRPLISPDFSSGFFVAGCAARRGSTGASRRLAVVAWGAGGLASRYFSEALVY